MKSSIILIAALLHEAEEYPTMAVLSLASGINQKQLSHYATGLKHPRLLQEERIKAGLHRIASRMMALVREILMEVSLDNHQIFGDFGDNNC